MKIITYHDSGRKQHWLDRLSECDWRAAAFLHKMLVDETFFESLGESSKLLLLIDGNELISFCTYAEKDDIPDTELSPWAGFVYTFSKYRGKRYAGLLLNRAAELAKADGKTALYISTDHVGLYEKYGFSFLSEKKDNSGEISRVYVKEIKP